MQRMLLLLTLMAGSLYLLACLTLFLSQHRLVYFPARQLVASPSDRGLRWQEHWITAADGVRLHAWYVPGGDDDPVVLFLHGNAGNISNRLDTLALLSRLGAGVLMLSYRGYGASGGEPDEEGTYRDADASHRYLVDALGIPAPRIVVFGRSLGGGIASWLAAERPCGSVILESTFTSIPDLGAEIYPLFPIRALARIRYDSLSRMARLQCPVLIIHGRDDEIVPFAHGQRLLAAAREPRSFLEIPGSHNGGLMLRDPAYRAALRATLVEVRRRAMCETCTEPSGSALTAATDLDPVGSTRHQR